MALPWALAVLSLLIPLVGADSPECVNITGTPITNASLDLITGKWFYIAAAFRHPEFIQWAKAVPSAFVYFTPNQTEDRVYLQEYITHVDKCLYNASHLDVQRENGTMSRNVLGVHYFAYVIPTKDLGIYMLAYYPGDKEKMGVSMYANTTQVSPEQMGEFHGAVKCLGLELSEIISTDATKDLCGDLEKEHEERRKSEGPSEDAAQA